MSETVAAFLLRHDSGRVAELLPVRYRRMQDNALAFFRGAVVPDALRGFGAGHHEWLEPLLTFARRAALVVRKDFRAFRASYKAGEVGIAPLVLLAH